MRGIIIKQPFAKKIIKRIKKTEYRNYKLPSNYLNKRIYLLSKTKVLGVIILSPKSKGEGYFRYKITIDQIFEPAKDYKHPMGAQLYVKDVKFK